jgi:NADP-dependent 3-hydroxy acid dehydrogenase YdfG
VDRDPHARGGGSGLRRSPVATVGFIPWSVLTVALAAEERIAAALPIFRAQGSGHFVNTASTAGLKVVANQAVYAGTKFAVRAISEGLRQEAGDKLRVTIISPGFTATNFADTVSNPAMKAQLEQSRDEFAMPPDAIAHAIAYAIEQPADVDVGEMVIRSTAQG